MAYAGHRNQNDVEEAFRVATKTLEFSGLQLTDSPQEYRQGSQRVPLNRLLHFGRCRKYPHKSTSTLLAYQGTMWELLEVKGL